MNDRFESAKLTETSAQDKSPLEDALPTYVIEITNMEKAGEYMEEEWTHCHSKKCKEEGKVPEGRNVLSMDVTHPISAPTTEEILTSNRADQYW